MSIPHQYPKHALQGIFYAKFKGEWLYYVRTDVTGPDDLTRKVKELSARLKQPARAYIEDWNFPKSQHDGFSFSTEL